MECYSFINYTNTNNSNFIHFDVDHTFILTMEKSYERHKNIYEQLKYFCPSKEVTIVLNKGFKKCKKEIYNTEVNKTYLDLSHANIVLFELSLKKKYKKILIIEDDFIWSEKLDNKDIISINKFINKNKNLCQYNLGPKPTIIDPLSIILQHEHIKLLIKGGTHASIYTHKGILETLSQFKKTTKKDIDVVTNFISNKYCYYKPICFQLYTNTTNSKEWSDDLDIIIFNKVVGSYSFIAKIEIYLVSLFKITDKNTVYVNYNRYFNFLIIINVLIYLLIIILIILIMKNIKSNYLK